MTLLRLATVAALTVAGLHAGFSAPAEAGGFYGVRVGYGGWYGPRRPFYRPVYRGFHRPYWRRPGVRVGYGRRYYHRGGGISGGEAAAIGLLSFGAGYVLSDTLNRNRAPDTVYVRTEPRDVYVEPRDVRRSAPPPQRAPGSDRPSWAPESFPGETCQVVREYQTTVIIGGVERDAYGPACLKPDGSWLQGPPRVVPGG